MPEPSSPDRPGLGEPLPSEPGRRTLSVEYGAKGSAGPSTLAEQKPAPAAAAAGQVFVAGYEILGELGRGGMAVVYRARQTSLKRLVALKMLLVGAHAGRELLTRLHTEAEAVARLQHPNIVQIYETGDQDGLPYLSLELVDGGSLEKRLTAEPWPAPQAAAMLEAVARAVHHAHQRGVVHRDLKPANILLTADDTPKVTDFGLAKRLDDSQGLTQTGVILGTPSYMAPEQAEGRTRLIGPATDVYALGAILYRLLTGRLPFLGESPLETLDQVRTQDVPPPGQVHAGVPPDLEVICLRCLQKERGARYPSAVELADDLRRFGAGEPPVTRSAGERERVSDVPNGKESAPRGRTVEPWGRDPGGEERDTGAAGSSAAFSPTTVRGRYRLRLLVTDRPGVLAAISRVLAEHQVSIASVFQQEAADEHEGDTVPLVITTHTVPASTLHAAVAGIDRLDCVRAPTVVRAVVE